MKKVKKESKLPSGVTKEMHESMKHDSGYQSRIAKLNKHEKSGGKGEHPMVKEHRKSQSLAKKVKKMGS